MKKIQTKIKNTKTDMLYNYMKKRAKVEKQNGNYLKTIYISKMD